MTAPCIVHASSRHAAPIPPNSQDFADLGNAALTGATALLRANGLNPENYAILKFAPGLAAVSGVLQLWSGWTHEGGADVGDMVVGGLNFVSGTAMTLVAFGVEIEFVPVFGQAAGVAAGVAAVVVVVYDVTKTPTPEPYFRKVLEKLKGESASYVAALGLREKVEALEKAINNTEFRQIAVVRPAGTDAQATRRALVASLTSFVGNEFAEKIVERVP